MQVVTYKNKEYKIPLDPQDKLIDVANPFSGAKASLPWFAVAVYDLIMGAQQFEDYETVQQGCDWFARHFPKEYMTLLD